MIQTLYLFIRREIVQPDDRDHTQDQEENDLVIEGRFKKYNIDHHRQRQ